MTILPQRMAGLTLRRQWGESMPYSPTALSSKMSKSFVILGMGWIYAATKLPVIGWIVDTLYEIWADWRLALTGRPDLKTIISDRQKRIECNTLQRCRLTDDD